MSVQDVLVSLNYPPFLGRVSSSLLAQWLWYRGSEYAKRNSETICSQIGIKLCQSETQSGFTIKAFKVPQGQGSLGICRSWVTHRKVTLDERPKGVTTWRSSGYVCVSSVCLLEPAHHALGEIVASWSGWADILQSCSQLLCGFLLQWACSLFWFQVDQGQSLTFGGLLSSIL